jgi:hypothetical protein
VRALRGRAKAQTASVPASRLGASGSIPGGSDFSYSFFGFPLLIINPPLLHTHLSPLPEVYDSLDQAAHYHILEAWVFDTDLTFGWLLWNKRDNYRNILCLRESIYIMVHNNSISNIIVVF